MIQKILKCIVCMCLVVFVACSPDGPKVTELPVDAITHATSDIEVKGGIAYNKHAYLDTYYADSYNKHIFAYGLTNNSPESTSLDTSLVYVDTLLMAATPYDQVCTLTNLIPDTTYFYLLMGGLDTNFIGENHHIKGTFQTAPDAE